MSYAFTATENGWSTTTCGVKNGGSTVVIVVPIRANVKLPRGVMSECAGSNVKSFPGEPLKSFDCFARTAQSAEVHSACWGTVTARLAETL